MSWEAHEERTERDNFSHSIYEPGYKGLLVARVNQNGRHPEHVEMILKAASGKREAAPLIEQQLARIAELEAALAGIVFAQSDAARDRAMEQARAAIATRAPLLET